MKRNRKAKILATLGPASSDKKIIEDLFVAGCDVFRLNFSHGDLETHRKNYETIRSLEEKHNHASCILADLQGPKLRVGTFKNTKENLVKGQNFILDLSTEPGDNNRVNFPHEEIYDFLTPNSILLVNDGRIRLQVVEQKKDSLITEVLNDAEISNNKGVNIPDVILPIDALTKKDKSDLMKALDMGVDWVALSFVQQAEDILKLKKIINNKALVMAKIEKPSAVKNIDDIINAADGIMIARGDLGVEMPTEQVPIVQKNIIKRCRHFGKPVVVATQMLESMIENLVPTRAEASDVAKAVFQGVDAVMLSAESAAGNYPKESVEMMDKIIKRVESDPKYLANIQNYNLNMVKTSTEAIATAALEVATIAECNCIATFSQSGRSVLRVARMRPDVTLIGLTTNKKVARQNALTWGTFMDVVDEISSSTEMVDRACKIAKVRKILKHGEKIIITAGVPFGKVGNTNILRIAKIISNSKLT